MSEDVSKAETQRVDEAKADPPQQGRESVHEQTRRKGERAREEREKMEEMPRVQDERNQKDSLEAPPGD